MKKLLLLLVWTCFCVVPVLAHAGNINPALYLEIFMYDTDPDDPDYGCVIGATCPEICGHYEMPLVGDIHCYNPKAPYFIGVVPIHVGKLATPPLAQGWPPPCGPGGGYITVSCGIQRSGAAVTYMGLNVCPNFVPGPGTAPGAIFATATTQCHDWVDHPCYTKWLTANTQASFFDVIGNVEDGNKIDLINCQAVSEASFVTVGGRAQWGGAKTVTCNTPIYPVEETTWSRIKATYR